MNDDKDKKSIFEFHTGYTLQSKGVQSVMDCPFCEHENKFFFTKEGLWDCKAGNCKKSGNAFGFIRQLYDHFDTLVRGSELVKDIRGIPTEYSRANGIKWNPLNNSILIPAFKHDKVHALYKAIKQDRYNEETKQWEQKWIILASPRDMGVEHSPMHWQESSQDIVWIVEGHWDKLAADAIIGHTNPITAVAVPGSGVWKPSWCEILDGKHVVFLYDNDSSGRAGYERVIIKEIANSRYKPKSIQYLHWPSNLPEGYDLNDLYLDQGRKAFDFIDENTKRFATPENTVVVKETIETVPPDYSCDSWDKFMHIFRKSYHVTPDMEMAVAALAASIYSLKFDGEQLWYKMFGPAGCGKTTLAKLLASLSDVVLRSTFTGLFSGWQDEDTSDASLAATIANKALVVKDADALMRQPNIAQIFSEFRDFYDKDSSTQFKNRVQNNYRNVRSSVMLFGTNVLRRSDQSFLGERFLDYELRLSDADRIAIKKMVRRKTTSQILNPGLPSEDIAVQSAFKGYMEGHVLNRTVSQALAPDQEEFIDRAATLVAKLRTDVDRDMGGKGEITFTPVEEVPSRLMGQLMKMALILPAITGDHRYVDPLVSKFCVDIIDPTSNRFTLIKQLSKGWYSRDSLVEETGIPKSTLTRMLEDLRIIKAIELRTVRLAANLKQYQMTTSDETKECLAMLGI